jgi:hypothetical protein
MIPKTSKLLMVVANGKSSQAIIFNLSKRLSSHFVYKPDAKAPIEGPKQKMNMFQAINNALDLAMGQDQSAIVFGKE